jgi:hypothetical protein
MKYTVKLDLLPSEKERLRKNKIRIADIPCFSIEEFSSLLQIERSRAMELHALVEFQLIPSIGVRFANDLISMGYYSLEELKEKDGASLLDEFELTRGYWIDPCVEDQFRLVVDFAKNGISKRYWWEYSDERKAFRTKYGYPANRPLKAWHENHKS